MVEYGSCYGFVCGKYCFSHVINVSVLSICIILSAFVVVLFIVCEFGVESDSYYFRVDVHGKYDVVYL